MQYYFAVIGNELLIHTVTQMSLMTAVLCPVKEPTHTRVYTV